MSKKLFFLIAVILMVSMACNLPFLSGAPSLQESPVPAPPILATVPATNSNSTAMPASTNTPVVVLHVIKPSDNSPAAGSIVYDVDSSSTAPEKRAPYGDSYNINRFERPFLQDMTYIPDLDILNFNFTNDDTFYYVSLSLVGTNPNNPIGIDYGMEVDTNHDGFGDYLIWARPPYGSSWTTANVQVWADKNHDTGGLSAEKSDAPLKGDGYETLVFDGNTGQGGDPDMAWARTNVSKDAAVQFAIKKSLLGSSFMIGVVSDAGLKDPGKFDYNDRFTEADAGSPIKNKQYYPLKALYAVDNTCWEAYGFKPTGYEPKLCPKEPPPTKQPGPGGPTPVEPPGGPTLVGPCQPPAGGCGMHYVWNQALCRCVEVLY